MRCLVTGAAGFIGSTLAERLLRDGVEVIGIDGFVDNYDVAAKRANLRALESYGGFRLIEGYVEDLELAPVLDGVERVFHLAALPGVRSSWGSTFQLYTAHNVHATQHLLEAARHAGVQRVVYASSSSVYGDTDVLPMREGAIERPYSPYGVTKLAAEHLARLYARNYGLDTVSVRYFTVYGPRQRPDMAIHLFMRAALDRTPIRLFGDGEQTRDFTFVDDAVEATLQAAERGRKGAVYNVGGGSTVTVNRLIEAIETVIRQPLEVRRESVQHGDVAHTCADTTRAREELQFVPSMPLEDGLRAEWEWLRTVEVANESSLA